jgi:hypothetical protein
MKTNYPSKQELFLVRRGPFRTRDELTYPKGRMSGGHSVSEPSAPARGWLGCSCLRIALQMLQGEASDSNEA